MLIKDTLLIRHFPSQLSHKEKEEFLTHFGAVDVQILGSENQKSNIIYAKYETETAAQIALKKLHQLEILDEILCVEIARGNKNCNNLHFPSQVQQLEKQSYLRKQQESFLQKINSWTKLVDLNYPPPAHLNYQYSPPTQQVLGNICKALSNVPKLYTQVLHLMNKMNLPCPFTDTYPLDDPFSLKKENMVYNQNNYHLIENFTDESCGEEESEIESDPENKNIFQNKLENFSPLKRKKLKYNSNKRLKFLKPTIPTIAQPKAILKTEDVFEKSDKDPAQRKIELKLTPGLISIKESTENQNIILHESFGIKHASIKTLDISNESEKNKMNEDNIEPCITEEALSINRISVKDQHILPIFKNYQAGVPSCRLYIKNLSKQVVEKDLNFIYKRYTVSQDPEQGNMFDIRLMQEGRMKGQAFVSLQTVELAQKALKETNGYILKEKPMVVQFARSAPKKV